MKKQKKLWTWVFNGVLMLVMALWDTMAYSQTQPIHYWTADSTQLSGAVFDNKGVYNLNFNGSSYQIKPSGKVGNYITMNSGTGLLYGSTSATSVTGSFSVEFLWRPGYEFNNCQFVSKLNNAWSLNFEYPGNNDCTPAFVFSVNTGSNSQFRVLLDSAGRKSAHYYLDGNWHHLVFQYNAANGVRKIFVDGVCPIGFTDTISGSPITTGDNRITLNSSTSYRKYIGDMDEIAIYNSAISPLQIYKHWITDVASNNHYSFTLAGSAPGAIATGTGIDSLDFAIGTALPTSGTHTTGATTSAINQLKNYPLPRYKPNNSLRKNFNWVDLGYLGGDFQSGVSADSVVRAAVALNMELAKRWNYMLIVNPNTSNYSNYNDTTKLQNKLVAQANANPNLQASTVSFWSQLSPSAAGYAPGGTFAYRKTLPENYYVRNSSGQFLDLNGNVTVSSGAKVLSPACPLDSIILDGKTQSFLLTQLRNKLTRPLNYISENDEVLPAWTDAALQLDPTVVAQKNASGMDWKTYKGWRKQVITKSYIDNAFEGYPSKPPMLVYKVEGRSNEGYSQYRLVNSQLRSQYYATPDYYPRWMYNWRNWNGAWNGLQHIIESRNVELASSDQLYAPFVSAGWDPKEDRNIRPGDWLGQLKLLIASGTEYFHTGFFNDASSYNSPNPPPPYPKNYVWQLSSAAYAQATASRAQDLILNGTLLPGNTVMGYDPPKTGIGYLFKSGNPHIPVMVRKLNSGNVYLIVGCIPRSSMDKNNAPLSKDVTIYLGNDTLKINVRRQGSMYVYDKRDPNKILFYQLDKWHEATHPSRWSNDIALEAELNDTSSLNVTYRTAVPAAAAKGDLTAYTTYANLSVTNWLRYAIEPRKTGQYYLYVKARAANGGTGNLNVKLGESQNYVVSNVNGSTFRWHRISLGSLNAQGYNFELSCSLGKLLVDKMVITEFLYSNAQLSAM
jgi:hypothetical protein